MRFFNIRTSEILILLACFWGSQLLSQSVVNENAGEYLKHHNYGAALPLIMAELKADPDNAQLNYQAGLCYLHSRSLKSEAVQYLEKAIEFSPSLRTKQMPGSAEAPIECHKLLGDAYYYAYKFEPAIKSYETFKELLAEKSTNHPLAEEANLRIELCRHLKDYRPGESLPVSSKTNSLCTDMIQGKLSSTLSADKETMIYTLKVPVKKLRKQDARSRYFEELDFKQREEQSEEDQETKTPSRLKDLIEKDSVLYAATIGTSFDGQVMLTYMNEDGEGTMYLSRLRDNKWSQPVKMTKAANRAGWEPYESMSADGNFLYFACDRPDGFGGMDIYRCKKEPDGTWSKAVNLGPEVNTAADEISPLIHADGHTLFFSSNRRKPGSYDIYTSTAGLASNWSKPLNVGFPINRNANDIFQVTANNKALYADAGKAAGKNETRKDSSDKKEKSKPKAFHPEKDNYLITFSGKHSQPLNLRRGTVTGKSGQSALSADIIVIDNKNGKQLAKHHTSDQIGAFSFILPAGKDLQILYDAKEHLPVSEHVDLTKEQNFFLELKAVKMPPLAAGSSCTLNNVFFDENKLKPEAASVTELQRMAELLKNHPYMEVQIESTITAKDKKGFYKKLARKRAKVVAEIMQEYGAKKRQLKTKGGFQRPEKVKEVKEKHSRAKKRVKEEEEFIPVQQLTFKIIKYKEDD